MLSSIQLFSASLTHLNLSGNPGSLVTEEATVRSALSLCVSMTNTNRWYIWPMLYVYVGVDLLHVTLVHENNISFTFQLHFSKTCQHIWNIYSTRWLRIMCVCLLSCSFFSSSCPVLTHLLIWTSVTPTALWTRSVRDIHTVQIYPHLLSKAGVLILIIKHFWKSAHLQLRRSKAFSS